MKRQGTDVKPEAFRDLVVGMEMAPGDWLRALGMAVAEVLQAIAEDIDNEALPARVSTFAELHDYLDANEYMLESPTCAKVWNAATTADQALPFLNAVTNAVDAALGTQGEGTAEAAPDLSADEIVIRSDLRLYRNRRGFTINRGLHDQWPADVGEVFVDDGEWMILIDDGDHRDEQDIRRVLGLDDE